MSETKTIVKLYNAHALHYNVFYSIKLPEYKVLSDFVFGSVITARMYFIILLHLNSYKSALQYDLVKMYGMRQGTCLSMLTLLLGHGLIKTVPCRRKTNIGYFVKFKSYQITPLGKTMVESFHALISTKISKLSK